MCASLLDGVLDGRQYVGSLGTAGTGVAFDLLITVDGELQFSRQLPFSGPGNMPYGLPVEPDHV